MFISEIIYLIYQYYGNENLKKLYLINKQWYKVYIEFPIKKELKLWNNGFYKQIFKKSLILPINSIVFKKNFCLYFLKSDFTFLNKNLEKIYKICLESYDLIQNKCILTFPNTILYLEITDSLNFTLDLEFYFPHLLYFHYESKKSHASFVSNFSKKLKYLILKNINVHFLNENEISKIDFPNSLEYLLLNNCDLQLNSSLFLPKQVKGLYIEKCKKIYNFIKPNENLEELYLSEFSSNKKILEIWPNIKNLKTLFLNKDISFDIQMYPTHLKKIIFNEDSYFNSYVLEYVNKYGLLNFTNFFEELTNNFYTHNENYISFLKDYKDLEIYFAKNKKYKNFKEELYIIDTNMVELFYEKIKYEFEKNMY